MREEKFFEQLPRNPSEAEFDVFEHPESELNREDINKINTIGELDAREKAAERASQIRANQEYSDGARESAEKWRRHKEEVLDFSVDKIKQLPNADYLMQFVNRSDMETIGKYDEQKQALIDQGVGASLMTPEEKQKYYDALSRKSDFINFLRDQYSIQQDAAKEIYQTLALKEVQADPANLGDARAAIDEWDRIIERHEKDSADADKLKKGREEAIDDEQVENQNVESPKEAKENLPSIKSFTTDKGSVYTYDDEGKTARFKTVENKKYERQDITVFVDLTPEEEKEFLKDMDIENVKVYIVEELPNGTPNIIRDISEIHNPEKIYIASLDYNQKRWVRQKKALLRPALGYAPFDTRTFEKDGGFYTERHLGNKIVEIETTQPPIAELPKKGLAAESASASDDIIDKNIKPVETVESAEVKIADKDVPDQAKAIEIATSQDPIAELLNKKHLNENIPAPNEKPVGNIERENESEIEINKEKIMNFIDSGRRLVRVFRGRDEERLNALIENRYIPSLAASFDNLYVLINDNKQAINREEFGHAIIRIADLIQNIGKTPREQRTSDNAESLGKVISRLRLMEDETHNITVSLSREKVEHPEGILKTLRSLEDIIKEKWIFVARKRSTLSEYQR